MDILEITIIILAIGNVIGMFAAYQIGWSSGYRAGKSEEPRPRHGLDPLNQSINKEN